MLQELSKFADECEDRSAQWEFTDKDCEEGILKECEQQFETLATACKHHLTAGKTAVAAKNKLLDNC